jgi:hypothetical protein
MTTYNQQRIFLNDVCNYLDIAICVNKNLKWQGFA